MPREMGRNDSEIRDATSLTLTRGDAGFGGSLFMLPKKD